MIRAGFFIRLLAFLVDSVASISAGWAVFYFAYHFMLKDDVDPDRAALIAGILFYGVFIPYSLSEVVFDRSPGKLVCRLVITRSADGTPADGWALFSRWATKFSPWIVNCIAIFTFDPSPLVWLAGVMQIVIAVGCLAALGERRRTFHDRWSGTAVCRLPRQAGPRGFEIIPGTGGAWR